MLDNVFQLGHFYVGDHLLTNFTIYITKNNSILKRAFDFLVHFTRKCCAVSRGIPASIFTYPLPPTTKFFNLISHRVFFKLIIIGKRNLNRIVLYIFLWEQHIWTITICFYITVFLGVISELKIHEKYAYCQRKKSTNTAIRTHISQLIFFFFIKLKRCYSLV